MEHVSLDFDTTAKINNVIYLPCQWSYGWRTTDVCVIEQQLAEKNVQGRGAGEERNVQNAFISLSINPVPHFPTLPLPLYPTSQSITLPAHSSSYAGEQLPSTQPLQCASVCVWACVYVSLWCVCVCSVITQLMFYCPLWVNPWTD